MIVSDYVRSGDYLKVNDESTHVSLPYKISQHKYAEHVRVAWHMCDLDACLLVLVTDIEERLCVRSCHIFAAKHIGTSYGRDGSQRAKEIR